MLYKNSCLLFLFIIAKCLIFAQNGVISNKLNTIHGSKIIDKSRQQHNTNKTGNGNNNLPFEQVMSLNVITTYTPQQLVQNFLITGCLQAFNITFTGDTSGIGYFSGASPTLNFSSGIILASGSVTNAIGPNNSSSQTGVLTGSEGDIDLANLIAESPSNVHDASILEFDFIPSSDTIEFQYVFGSEEYPEFANSSFNDVFGFFLSQIDPPPGGPYNYSNIALIPGTTTPVSINNVNNGTSNTGPCMNCSYYTDNSNDQLLQYDGLTVTLTARATVQACHTYHIKLAIADLFDHSFDSGVFLKEGSFSSGISVAMQNHSMLGTDHDLYEGCTNYYVFARTDTTNLTDTIQINLMITGNASTGLDLTPIPTQLYILPGFIYDTLYYSAFLDDLTEGTETVVFSVANGCQCAMTLISDTIRVFDNWHLNAGIDNNTTICLGDTVTLNTTVDPGFALNPSMLSYLWSTGDTTSSVSVSPIITSTYFVTINDPCSQDTVMQITVTVVPAINNTFHSNKDSVCTGEHAIITFDGSTGTAAVYTWSFSGATIFSGTGSGPYELAWGTEGNKTVTLQITDNGCSQTTSHIVHVNPIPVATISSTDVICNGACDGTATVIIDSTITTHLPFIYSWDDPGSQNTIQATALCPGTYSVTFTNSGGCQNSGSANISQPAALSANITGTDVLCFNGNQGSVTLSVVNGLAPYTYLWSNGAVTQNLTNLTSGNYSVVITDNNGCTLTKSVIVNQPAMPVTVNITTQNVECFGDYNGSATALVSGGTYPYSYFWNDQDLQVSSTAYNLGAGQYYVSVYDMNNCLLIDTVNISEPPLLTISVTSTPASCYGSSDGTVTVAISGGTPVYNIAWSNGAVSATSVNLLSGRYDVTVTDNNNCISSSYINVSSPTQIQVFASDDKWVCKGGTTEISAEAYGGTGTYTYIWRGSDSSNIIGQIVNVSLISSTTYFVSVTDQAGCHSGLANVSIQVYPPLDLSVFTFNDSVCYGQSVEIRANVAGGNGGPYQIILNDTGLVIPPFEVFPDITQIYSITAKDNICPLTVTDSLYIFVLPAPPVIIEADKFQGCVPLTVHFSEISLNEGQSYSWNFGDMGYSQAKNPVHVYSDPGNYFVSLTVTSDLGCRKTSAFVNSINAFELPDARFYYTPDNVNIIKPEYEFFNITDDIVSSIWQFGDGTELITSGNPVHLFPSKTGSYNVNLIVQNANLCVDTFIVPVRVDEYYTFYAPTAFSTDKDDMNSYFSIYSSGIDESKFLIIIYDRWGMKLFESKDIHFRWNGKNNASSNSGGKFITSGVYTWIATFNDNKGNQHQQTGTVTIVR